MNNLEAMSRNFSPPNPILNTPQEPMEAFMLAKLRAQVEYYFSPPNLAKDAYLRTQLQHPDHLGAVPIEVIANFPKIREHHAAGRNLLHIRPFPPAEPEVLVRALEGSQVVTVSEDGRYISPVAMPPPPVSASSAPTPGKETASAATRDGSENAKQASSPSSPSSQATSSSAGIPTHPNTWRERTSVLVRDVPQECSAEELVAAFSTEIIKPKSVQCFGDNMWIITLETEEQAVAATQIREIKDCPIQVLLIDEAGPRHIPQSAPPVGMYPPLPPQQQVHPGMPPPMPPGYPPYGMQYYGVPFVPPQVAQPQYPYVMQYPMPPPAPHPSHVYVTGPMNPPPGYFQQQQQGGDNRQQRRRYQQKRGRGRSGQKDENYYYDPQRQDNGGSASSYSAGFPREQRRYSGDSASKQRPPRGRRRDGDNRSGDSKSSSPVLGDEHFPALNGGNGTDSGKERSSRPQQLEDTPKVAYAAALLRPKSAPSSAGESTAQSQVEADISKMTLSSDTAESTQEPRTTTTL